MKRQYWQTATLSQADLIRTLVLAWAVQTFHALGLLEAVAIYANKLNNIKYTTFLRVPNRICRT